MKSLIAALTLTLCGALAARADAPVNVTGAATVDAQKIIALVESKPELVIVDARRAEDFNSGHLEGAKRILDTEMTPEALSGAVKTKETPVLFYCNGMKCGRAAKAAEAAVGYGYSQVYYYALGIEEWSKLSLPLMK